MIRVDIPELQRTKTLQLDPSQKASALLQNLRTKLNLPGGNRYSLFARTTTLTTANSEYPRPLGDGSSSGPYGHGHSSGSGIAGDNATLTRVDAEDDMGEFVRQFGSDFVLMPRSPSSPGSGERDADNVVVRRCVDFLRHRGLHTEGIFRLSGSTLEVQRLKAIFDSGEDYLIPFGTDPHAVAGLLKLHLREMCPPLLTYELHDAFLEVARSHLPRATLKSLVALLPQPQRTVLGHLLAFLAEVNAHESTNKMSLPNIATVIGPNILRGRDESAVAFIRDAALVNEVTLRLLRAQADIFTEDPSETTFALCRVRPGYTVDGHAYCPVQGTLVFVRGPVSPEGWVLVQNMATESEMGYLPPSVLEVIAGQLEESEEPVTAATVAIAATVAETTFDATLTGEDEDLRPREEKEDKVAVLEAHLRQAVDLILDLQRRVQALEKGRNRHITVHGTKEPSPGFADASDEPAAVPPPPPLPVRSPPPNDDARSPLGSIEDLATTAIPLFEDADAHSAPARPLPVVPRRPPPPPSAPPAFLHPKPNMKALASAALAGSAKAEPTPPVTPLRAA